LSSPSSTGEVFNTGSTQVAAALQRKLSAKAERFTESVIREMTRLAMQYDAVNMAQGFPDFSAAPEVKEAARQAISDDINQYAITWGAKELRDAIARKFERTQGVRVDPEREITVTCGSTEAMMATLMGIINPGDEVVIAPGTYAFRVYLTKQASPTNPKKYFMTGGPRGQGKSGQRRALPGHFNEKPRKSR